MAQSTLLPFVPRLIIPSTLILGPLYEANLLARLHEPNTFLNQLTIGLWPAVGELRDQIGPVPLEPSSRKLALSHTASHKDLECSFSQCEWREIIAIVVTILRQQAVGVIAFPVEFLLQGNHSTTEANRLRSLLLNYGQSGSRPPDNSIGEGVAEVFPQAV